MPQLCVSGAQNLNKDIDEKSVYDKFREIGEVFSCKLPTDAQGRSRSHAWVYYVHQESASAAIQQLNGREWHGKLLYVAPYVPRNERHARRLRLWYYGN